MSRNLFASLFLALFAWCAVTPAFAADGQVLITDAKARAGNVTPGDTAGYPVTLSRAGSYILGSDLFPDPGRDGIAATLADIAIDLNGFRISGGPAGGINNARIGIYGHGDRLTVKNGTIGAFQYGIYAPTRGYLIVENMRIINSGAGIHNPSSLFARIQNSTVATNTGDGISCGGSCHVEGNVVSGNGGIGVKIARGTVLGNTIASNGGHGIRADSALDEDRTGIGNNTIINNGGVSVAGNFIRLFPNACYPDAC